MKLTHYYAICYSVYAALRSISSGYSNLIVIDAEDTDVYIQATAISHEIPGIIIRISKKQFLFCCFCFFCRGMCTDDFAKSFIPFHGLAGCDANSCFSGHSKIFLYEKLSKRTEASSLISKCREGLLLSDDVLNDLKSFVLQCVCFLMMTIFEPHIKCSNFLAYVQCLHDLSPLL